MFSCTDLVANLVRSQLVHMQDDPDELGGIVKHPVSDPRNAVVLEVHVLHARGHKGHVLKVAAVAVHGIRVGRRALALQGAVQCFGVILCMKGSVGGVMVWPVLSVAVASIA